jgi:hypothetical protein
MILGWARVFYLSVNISTKRATHVPSPLSFPVAPSA